MDAIAEVLLALEEESPAIRSNACTVDVVWVPCPYGIECGGFQFVDGVVQRGRVVQAEVSAEPVEDDRAGLV